MPNSSKIATIVPVAHLSSLISDKYVMALSYPAHSANYIAFFRNLAKQGAFVMLDNSAVEMGQPEPIDSYVAKAIAMKASEIVLPDYFQDANRTLEASKACIELARDLGYAGQFMGVPQGATAAEWLRSAFEMLQLGVHCLGVSRRYVPSLFPEGRAKAVEILTLLFQLENDNKTRVHLLGCLNSPTEEGISHLLQLYVVRGVDSSVAALATKNGMRYTGSFQRTAEMGQVDISTDIYDYALWKRNLEAWRRLCQR